MTIARVAIVYDDTLRPETSGLYCRRALGKLVEVEHFLPTELAKIPQTGFDLYLNVDDGLRYRWPTDLRPCAWWAIDTHMDFEWYRQKGVDFDLLFAAQRDGAERLKSEGISKASWLPLACDPDLHAKQDVAKSNALCFIGNLFPGPRADLVWLLRREFPGMVVGNAYFEEMARIYSQSRIVFNRSVRNDVNMRVFEALCSGSLLLTNDLSDNGLAELFRDGIHQATYREPEEMLDKVRYYLAHEEVRERIAAEGRREALAKHTYEHRMRELLSTIERQQRTVVSVSAPMSNGDAGRDRSYFEHARPEILERIPTSVCRVLDIGCGSGRLGETLKARQAAEVVGVELDSHAAEFARARLDAVHVGDVESEAIDFEESRFDCVVCGDVLEHVRDPGRLLNRIRRWLAPEGQLVTSIPNVRHHSVITSLLDGNWTYEPAGLLDRDHLRFFTRREIEKLLFRAGFDVESLGIVPGPGYEEWAREGKPGTVKMGGLHIGGLDPADAEEFFAYQYLVVARPASRTDVGLTSIVIVTHNQLPLTHECLSSIRERTDERIELIVVDNGSTDGTPQWLGSQPDVRLISNSENRGFPAAANQGVAAASGRHVLLLNNDCVVTTGWLTRMLAALHSDPTIGLVGPCTNNISGEQQVPVRYFDLSSLDGFAWDFSKRHRGQTEETDRLVGFCLLIKRDLIDKIGLLDERFGIGCFEDDDFTRRANAAGYRAVIARDSFIHHVGSATFRASGIDFTQLMQRNERLFREKWSPAAAPSTNGNGVAHREPPSYTLIQRPGGGLLLQRAKVRLSLCMIVRNNEGTIRPCLESIRPWVDEMIVVDTGSTDRTPVIAEEFGARLFHFPWIDDFASARNESLRHARGEWSFWMDSDDTISPECGRRLRDLALGAHAPSVHGYVMQVHCPGGGDDRRHDVTVVDHVKLFRNRPDLRFEGRIHEQILPAIRQAGGEVGWTDIHVVHSGSDRSVEGQKGKLARDFKLLELDLKDRPDHPFVLFNLGMTQADADMHEDAVGSLRRCLEVSQPTESHVRKAYALLVSSLSQCSRHTESWEACSQGRRLYPEDAELLFREAMLHHHFGRLTEAERSYLAVLQPVERRYFSSYDQGICGFKARHNLAIVYEDMRDASRAIDQWQRILREVPDYQPARFALSRLLTNGASYPDAGVSAAT